MSKRILVYGDDHLARELAGNLNASSAEAEVVYGEAKALEELERIMPDALVFVMKVYSDTAPSLVKKIHLIPGLERLPIFYIGDFIESKKQIFLQELGVKTLTLGPVPPEEGARYILSQIW